MAKEEESQREKRNKKQTKRVAATGQGVKTYASYFWRRSFLMAHPLSRNLAYRVSFLTGNKTSNAEMGTYKVSGKPSTPEMHWWKSSRRCASITTKYCRSKITL